MGNRNNDNEVSSLKNNNDNNNDIDWFKREQKVESIAAKLVEKFNSPGSWAFYCDIARKLPENIIWQNYEKATNPSKRIISPGGLFNKLCRLSIYKQNSRG